jgi:hypothetical protein
MYSIFNRGNRSLRGVGDRDFGVLEAEQAHEGKRQSSI